MTAIVDLDLDSAEDRQPFPLITTSVPSAIASLRALVAWHALALLYPRSAQRRRLA